MTAQALDFCKAPLKRPGGNSQLGPYSTNSNLSELKDITY